ncbi:UNVERIFIED_ORG: glycosyltransferase involved in cell wall biosynthesis [Burkholderia sp. 1263]
MNLKTIKAPRPTVVVVVPFYNGSRWIDRALQSIYDQTVPADEVIVVNDGSHADERAALQVFSEHYPFRIIDKENGGQGSARNAGVAASTSDFICFLDQDDFYLRNHIELLTHAIPKNDHRFGWVYGDAMEADGDGNIVRTSMVKEHATHPKHDIVDLLRHDMFVTPGSALISRIAFESVGGFDPQFMGYEDDDLFLRIFRKGYSNYFIDRSVYVWCIHPESTSYTVRMSRSRFRYFTKLAGMFPDDKDRARYYFRDCLIPRFGRAFIRDALKAVKDRSEHRTEVASILKQYTSMVLANRYTGRRHKTKLAVTTFILTQCPVWAVTAISLVATRLPIVRRLVA